MPMRGRALDGRRVAGGGVKTNPAVGVGLEDAALLSLAPKFLKAVFPWPSI